MRGMAGLAGFTQGATSTWQMIKQAEELDARRKQREEEAAYRREQRDNERAYQTDMKEAAKPQGPMAEGTVLSETTDTGPNRLFVKDAQQAKTLQESIAAEAEMRGTADPTAKAGVGAGSKVFDSTQDANAAGYGGNTRPERLQRMSDAALKHGRIDDSTKLIGEAKRLREEGAVEALQAVMAGRPPSELRAMFDSQGKQKLAEDPRIVVEENNLNPVSGRPTIRVYGRMQGEEKERPLDGGFGAENMLYFLRDPERAAQLFMAGKKLQMDESQRGFENNLKTNADVRAERSLTEAAKSGEFTRNLQERQFGLSVTQANRQAANDRFNQGLSLKQDARADVESGLRVQESAARLNPVQHQIKNLESLGFSLSDDQKKTLAGLDSKAETKVTEFYQDLAKEGVKAGTMKAEDAAKFVNGGVSQHKAQKALVEAEPTIRKALDEAFSKGEGKKAVESVRQKFPGLSEEWFKANGYDPKADLNSFKSGAWTPIEKAVSAELGIDPKYLETIRTKGEKSNGNQVSPKGAASVYQIMPDNAEAFAKSHGLDIKKPRDAAMVAGLLVKERLAYYKDLTGRELDEQVYRSYHAGYKGARGPVNEAYAKRTMGDLPEKTIASSGSGGRQGTGTKENPEYTKAVADVRNQFFAKVRSGDAQAKKLAAKGMLNLTLEDMMSVL